MRKILYLLAIMAVAGCQKNEPDLLMGKNASERMAQNKENLKKTLSEAPNGWRLSYFPKRNTFGGYTFLMKFTPEGRVIFIPCSNPSPIAQTLGSISVKASKANFSLSI